MAASASMQNQGIEQRTLLRGRSCELATAVVIRCYVSMLSTDELNLSDDRASGSVTMLMLLMPDCRRASISVAKAPKGTVLSQRRKMPSFGFFILALILGPSSCMLTGSLPRINELILVHGDDDLLLVDLPGPSWFWGHRLRCRTGGLAR